MSLAKKCDRCGVFYTSEAYNAFCNGLGYELMLAKHVHGYPVCDIDLCCNCTYELDQFLNKSIEEKGVK